MLTFLYGYSRNTFRTIHKRRAFRFVLVAAMVLLSGCPFFTFIGQPRYAFPGDLIQVPFEVFFDGAATPGFFGIYMPEGWNIDGDTIYVDGGYRLFRDSANTALMNSVDYFNWEDKKHYSWWASQYTGGDSLGPVKAVIPIRTSDSIGIFYLDYVMAYFGSADLDISDISRNHIIEILADSAAPILLQDLTRDNHIAFTWNRPVHREGLQEYAIYRNGEVIGNRSATDTSFSEPTPLDGIHEYSISALYQDGSEHFCSFPLTIVGAHLYVSPGGNDGNVGDSFERPLKTIHYVLERIDADTANPKTIYLDQGTYSSQLTGEEFPLRIESSVDIRGHSFGTTLILADQAELGFVFTVFYSEDVEFSNLVLEQAEGLDLDPFLISESEFQLSNSIIRNFHTETSDGMRLSDSKIQFLNVVIENMELPSDEAVIRAVNSWLEITNSTFANNKGAAIDCFVHDSIGGVNLQNSIFFGNGGSFINSSLDLEDSEVFDVSYSNIENGWPGEGNIDLEPAFDTTGPYPYLLMPGSPGVDEGNPEELFNDREDSEYPGAALYPSMGSLRNDMGAYGGPWIFSSDVSVGTNVIPMEKSPRKGSPELRVYPNPAIAGSPVYIRVTSNERVTLKVYSAIGKEVDVLQYNRLVHGTEIFKWAPGSLPSGTYFIVLQTGTHSKTKRVMVVK